MRNQLSRICLVALLLLACSLLPATAQSASEMPEATVAAGVAAVHDVLTQDPSFAQQPITRAELAVVLARMMAGSDEGVSSGFQALPFTDVPPSHWAYHYIAFLRANNVFFGYADRTFHPDDVVTRGQLAVTIARVFEQDDRRIPSGPATPTFADVPSDSPFFRFVEYLAQRGAMQGTADGLFHPEDVLTWQDIQQALDMAFAPADLKARMIGGDPRMAVVYECWYALRRSYLTTPNANGPSGGLQIGGMMVSDWRYLNNDPNAINVIKGIYGSNVSRCPSWYSCNSGYSYGLAGGYGRGGQCVSFAATILFRSRNYRLVWSWGNTRPCNYSSARNAQPGDLIFRKSGTWHVAVVVKNLGYGLDVVDSNLVGYGSNPIRSGYKDSEIIGRHPFTWSQLDTGCWKTYSGRGRWY